MKVWQWWYAKGDKYVGVGKVQKVKRRKTEGLSGGGEPVSSEQKLTVILFVGGDGCRG